MPITLSSKVERLPDQTDISLEEQARAFQDFIKTTLYDWYGRDYPYTI